MAATIHGGDLAKEELCSKGKRVQRQCNSWRCEDSIKTLGEAKGECENWSADDLYDMCFGYFDGVGMGLI